MTQPAVEAGRTPLRRLLDLLRPERGDILAVVAFAVAVGVLLLATPIAVQAIVNSVALGGLLQPLVVVATLLMIALGFAAALFAVQTWIVEVLQRRLFVRLVADFSARLPRVRMDEYETGHGPELVNRFFDILTIQKAAPKLLIDALGMVLAVLVGLTVLAFYHPLLLAFDIILLVTIAIIVLGPLRRGERTAVAESSAKYAVAAWLEEVARNPYTFKTGGSDRWIFERADVLTRAWVDSRGSHFRVLFSQVLAALTLQVVASTALLGIGGLLVIQGSLTLGQLVAAELIVTAVVASVAKFGKHLETWYDLMAAVHKVGQVLDVRTERTGGEVTVPADEVAGGAALRTQRGASLELTDVSWRGTRDHALFSGVSLSIRPGERIGVTGPTGAGKSALIDVLWRLRDPATGAIRLDGRDLRDLAPNALRNEVAVVSPVEVVRGTVRENVRLQRSSVSNDDVRDAIGWVGLEDAVGELRQGLDTVLYPGARTLSEGELRLLMLARAIVSKPSLLAVDALFDRSPVDARERIFDALFDPVRGWTLVVVSNLPEVLERCDRVVRLAPGGAAEATDSRSPVPTS